MRVALIAAVARNSVIGKDGALPWRLPDELRYFKAQTLGKPVIMGRRTWESLRGPLPGRTNIVVTRQRYEAAGAVVVHSLEDAIAHAARENTDEAMIIGGAALYAEALPIADRLYLTHVDADVDGDAHFPPLDLARWRNVREEAHAADDRHAYPFRMVVYDRVAR